MTHIIDFAGSGFKAETTPEKAYLIYQDEWLRSHGFNNLGHPLLGRNAVTSHAYRKILSQRGDESIRYLFNISVRSDGKADGCIVAYKHDKPVKLVSSIKPAGRIKIIPRKGLFENSPNYPDYNEIEISGKYAHQIYEKGVRALQELLGFEEETRSRAALVLYPKKIGRSEHIGFEVKCEGATVMSGFSLRNPKKAKQRILNAVTGRYIITETIDNFS